MVSVGLLIDLSEELSRLAVPTLCEPDLSTPKHCIGDVWIARRRFNELIEEGACFVKLAGGMKKCGESIERIGNDCLARNIYRLAEPLDRSGRRSNLLETLRREERRLGSKRAVGRVVEEHVETVGGLLILLQ